MFGFGRSRESKAAADAATKAKPGSASSSAGNARGADSARQSPSRALSHMPSRMPSPAQQAPQRLIEQFDAVPPYSTVLTMGARAVMRLSKDVEGLLAAIEVGPRRAVILYCPDAAQAKPELRAAVGALRTKLMASGFTLSDDGDQPCKADVIRLLIADHQAKVGSVGEGVSDAKVKSQARERFMGWLSLAVREGATDIHVQVSQGRTKVHLRVDGELELLRDERSGIYTETEGLEAIAWPFNSAASRGSNSSAQWDSTRNLYCMTEPRTVADKSVVLRYQSLRGYLGPKMIARILHVDMQASTLSYDQLGYAPSQSALMRDAANMPSGFVLFAGVTGSGKTTTLKTFVETHPGQGSMAIYSIEDPVEYPLRGVHQIVLQRDLMDAAGSMRQYNETVASLVRADPDVVIVGEFRDMASARAGQQIVETGHMALGTVHAHLMSGIVPRLTNEEIGMNRDVLTNPNMLSLLAYQALVPKLCPHCRLGYEDALLMAGVHGLSRAKSSSEESHEAQHLTEVVQALDERFKVTTSGLRFRNTAGCKHCSFRGTSGVTVVAEMMIPDRRWLELTRNGMDYEATVHYRSQSDGRFDTPDMTGKTILEHTLYKSLDGTVDPRQCQRFDSLKRFDLFPEPQYKDGAVFRIASSTAAVSRSKSYQA
jgi:type II secretory ATPase GspE/PulE/Tfp pilus assembly ATPase PilB-like protein